MDSTKAHSNITAKVVGDSISPEGIRITTMQLHYPRFIHAEFMTHRMFCLSGDSRLDFELPAGQTSGARRVYSMSIRDFVHKWIQGSNPHKSSKHNGVFLEGALEQDQEYSADKVADVLGLISNINKACREGKVPNCYKKFGSKKWFAKGADWVDWRDNKTGTRTFSLVSRLKEMQIRQYNELTKEVVLSNIVNCVSSGTKEVFRLTAGSFSCVATKDHRILTGKGWKRLEEIVVGEDTVITYKYGSGESDPNKHKCIDGRWVQSWIRQVKAQVAARQNNLCAETNKPLDSVFHIHHIVPVHKDHSQAFDLDNVIAVNEDAHKQLHSKQDWQVGVALNTQETLVTSIVADGEIDTYDLEIAGDFANFFADGIVVHNSRNASSSRAIPAKNILDTVKENPAMPVYWGKNQPGMQAKEELDPVAKAKAQQAWLVAMDDAINSSTFISAQGCHKQIVNRITEPWQYINVIVTATEYENFFWLRNHQDAQPEIKVLAEKMYSARQESWPTLLHPGEWHLPFVDFKKGKYFVDGAELTLSQAQKVSASACAQVSYRKNDLSVTKAEDIWQRLIFSEPMHASPVEHQATPINFVGNWRLQNGITHEDQWGHLWSGNFRGWIQFRKTLQNEAKW
jgi:hypothetical protein